ncbi:MAG: DUF1573 domain-containing protein [Planctomycetaceae bacterium]|nr:DUF1573 domain-containing protein [Planctomycetaceae bacterium]
MNFTYYLPIDSLRCTVFVRAVSVLFLSVFCCNAVWAQSWADNLFTIKSHDFGNVPLLSDTQYSFVFHNTTKQDIHITSVTSSCTCTDASAPVKTIKSGEKGEIIAKINTSGQRTKKQGATITVAFDKPSIAYVQLEVSVYIRPDIVLNPGSVDFGAVREGQKTVKTVQLQYAGSPNWRLVRIDRANKNPYIHATATLQENSGSGREITYKIEVTLSDKAPAGYVREILRFVTNDQNSIAIELPISGFIMDALVAKPSPFQFGSIAPGETVTKYLVLRASQPFRIKSVKCPEDRRFVFSPSDQSSSVHIIAVTLTSQQENAENVARTIHVETTLEDQGRLKIPVYTNFLSTEDVNFNEYYAPQWKSLIASRNAERIKPRPLPTRAEEWDDLPVDAKMLDKITSEGISNEIPEEEETEESSLDLSWEIPVESFETDSTTDFPEYPPPKKIDALDAQGWVPLSESREMTESKPVSGMNNENGWQPSVASSTPLQRSRPSVNSMQMQSASTGKVRFGTPQKSPVSEESTSLANEVGQEMDSVPKKIVAKPLPAKNASESR